MSDQLIVTLRVRAAQAWRDYEREDRSRDFDSDPRYAMGVYHGFRDAYYQAGGQSSDLMALIETQARMKAAR